MISLGLLLALPLAHLMPTGLGPWGDGMARLVLQPTDLLLLIGLVLLAAQGGRACADRLPLLFPLAWLLGGLAGLTLSTELLLALPCMAAVTAIGFLVALDVRLRPLTFLVLSTGLAIAFGIVAGSALASPTRARCPPWWGRRWRSPCSPPCCCCRWLRPILVGWPWACGWVAAGSPLPAC